MGGKKRGFQALALHPDADVGGRIGVEYALDAVFERADVASPFADMIDRELDMRAEIADRKFIARDDIALELWRDGQAGALRREQRIVGTVGTRQRAVESVIGDRSEEHTS